MGLSVTGLADGCFVGLSVTGDSVGVCEGFLLGLFVGLKGLPVGTFVGPSVTGLAVG